MPGGGQRDRSGSTPYHPHIRPTNSGHQSTLSHTHTHIPSKTLLQAADREGVSKFGKRVLFDAATELPGSGVTSNGVKYTTKVIGVFGWMDGSSQAID